MIRDARFDIRCRHPECLHVIVVSGSKAPGYRADRLTGFHRSCVDFVVYVRDVSDVGDLRVELLKKTCQHVKDDGGPGVADVGKVVDGRSTHVHPYGVRLLCFQRLFPAGPAVV